MEVDALTKSGSRSGKGQQKEKETRACYHCGKVGHLAADCWQKEKEEEDYDKVKVKGKGKGRGKGKSKGKNKGKQRHVNAVEWEEDWSGSPESWSESGPPEMAWDEDIYSFKHKEGWIYH